MKFQALAAFVAVIISSSVGICVTRHCQHVICFHGRAMDRHSLTGVWLDAVLTSSGGMPFSASSPYKMFFLMLLAYSTGSWLTCIGQASRVRLTSQHVGNGVVNTASSV